MEREEVKGGGGESLFLFYPSIISVPLFSLFFPLHVSPWSPHLPLSQFAAHPEPSTCRHGAVPSANTGGSHIAGRAEWVPSSTGGVV